MLVVKNPRDSAGDPGNVGSIPGLGRSPGGGNGNPLQYSCLKNPMDRGAWWATVNRFASWTWLKWLSMHTCYWWEPFFSYTYKHFWYQIYVFPRHQPILQVTQYQVGVLQFSYGTNYPELAQTSPVKGPLSYDSYQLQTPVINPRF